jgi:CheY-like chemotaxis protein
MNLGANAAHALSAGGVLTVGLKSIAVTKATAARSRDLHAGEYVRISVQDTGTGMSKETLSRIFEPFFTTKGPEGSGLGMSVVHGLIKDHGGAITVESEPGKGTKVEVYFPVTLARSADAHLNKEELDAFRANPDQFDAVISDMAMPNLSGADVAREISGIRPDLPIALTSGRIEQDSESVSHFEGVMAWLSKPATIDEIGAVLATMLQDRADGQGD